MPLSPKILKELRSRWGERCLTSEEDLHHHGFDETEDLKYLPEVVLEPENKEEISEILSYCYEKKIPVTTRGGGTGLSGGALPVQGGVVLAMKKLDKILKIDKQNYQCITQPGVITQVLQDAVEEKGLFYPVDPASRGSCFIGGNVAENSGGPRAVKYGVVKDWVLNLEVVLMNGSVIRTGANVLKNSTGYNLTQLLVGSEGTLGVITEVTLRLIKSPPYKVLMLVPFSVLKDSARAVVKLMNSGITPSALEFMEREALELSAQYIDDAPPIAEDIEAHLLIELDGFDEEKLAEQAEKIYEVLQQFPVGEILFADDQVQMDILWQMRRTVGEAVKRTSLYKEEDTVVPRKHLPELLMYVKEVGKKYGFRSVCYGHAGDGNLHVNILKDEMSTEQWENKLPEAIREIFYKVKELGGMLSGEHGIGWVQKNYLSIFFSEEEMQLMKGIKNVFDPSGLLNPGKIFPD